MINHYTNHAANERTFLAWLRTGIAIIAFGFFVQKSNVPVAAASVSTSSWFPFQSTIAAILGAFGRYDGLALSIIGIAILLLASLRFVRAARNIDRPEPHRAAGMRIELLLTGALVLMTATLCAYLSMQ